MLTIRNMLSSDVKAVLSIQGEPYVSVEPEPENVIKYRLASSPEMAWVLENDCTVCGCLVAYRSGIGSLTEFGAMLGQTDKNSSLYVHSLMVSKGAIALGGASLLVKNAADYAKMIGLGYSSLVSVKGALCFWRKLGFSAVKFVTPILHRTLANYDSQTIYMIKAL